MAYVVGPSDVGEDFTGGSARDRFIDIAETFAHWDFRVPSEIFIRFSGI